MPYLPKLHSPEQIERWILEILEPKECVWVALKCGEIVGFVSYKGEMLNHLYVLTNHQSIGIGQRLLDIAKKSSPVLRLYVFQRNKKARSFYEKRGFKLLTLSDGAGNEEREPDAFYEWRPGS